MTIKSKLAIEFNLIKNSIINKLIDGGSIDKIVENYNSMRNGQSENNIKSIFGPIYKYVLEQTQHSLERRIRPGDMGYQTLFAPYHVLDTYKKVSNALKN